MADKLINEFDMPAPRWMRSYPAGPYRFVNREFFVLTYETDAELLKAVLPPGLELIEPVIKFEFIRMPDSTGFGDYTESGQIIPVRYKGVKPDMFQTGVDVIVEGRIGHDGVLAASILMTSCPSKYQEEKSPTL